MMQWIFGCDGWVIADGTYPHIEVGRVLEASIEFWYTGRLAVVHAAEPAVQLKKDHTYAVTAPIVEKAGFVVLDLGPLHVSCVAATHTQFDELHPGDVVEGTIRLALNPFDWDATAIPRRRSWIVDAITRTRRANPLSRRPSPDDDVQSVSLVDSETYDDDASYEITCTLVEPG